MRHGDSNAVRVGLIGAGIQASRSPHLHETEARALGIDCSYRLIDLTVLGAGSDALPRLLAEAEAQGYAGVNITHPCKQAVVSLLDQLSPEAEAIGAVNTVVFQAGRRIGHNTDCLGFAESFRRGLPDVARETVVLLGAGGAGAAVAHAMLGLDCGLLLLYDVDCERAASLAAGLRRRFDAGRVACVEDLPAAMADADGFIQATPIGMRDHPGAPLPLDLVRPAHWVAEIIYFPLETELLKYARTLGCRTLDGGGMAVFQAAEAFRLFTGVPPDPDRMLRSFAAA